MIVQAACRKQGVMILGYGSDQIAWVKQNLVDDMVHFLEEVEPGYGDTKIKELMNLVADAIENYQQNQN